MGTYTSVRAKLRLKPEYTKKISRFLSDWMDSDLWQELDLSFQYQDRASFIPFGALSYVDWDENDPEWKITVKDHVFIFQCSLKNYCGTIERFIDEVVPEICQDIIHLEVKPEWTRESSFYEMKDGYAVFKERRIV